MKKKMSIYLTVRKDKKKAMGSRIMLEKVGCY